MALQKTDFALFPEEYLLEEDEMGESVAQHQIIGYLMAVLGWVFRLETWNIAGNLELYHREVRNTQNKITPDISVFKGISMVPEQWQGLKSLNIERSQAKPSVVIEISSNSTWRSDIIPGENNKPAIYGRLDVKEYFAYDPNDPPVWRGTNGRRLLGWRYANGLAIEIQPDELGRLWSEELDSWLKEDGWYLRLYDRDNNLQLTEAEAERQEKEAKDLALQTKDLDIQTRDNAILELANENAELKRLLREMRGEDSQK